MTPEEIIELAGHRPVTPWIMKLVMDAVAHEREECAKVCDGYSEWNKDYREMRGFNDRLSDCAATIRAMGEK